MAYSSIHLFVDDVEIGQAWESPARTITQTDIVNFAGLSGDFNPIHVDHEYSAKTPFGEPVAHGLLVLSIASGLSISSPPMRTIAFKGMKEWNFRYPVRIGDTIRMCSTIVDINLRARNRRGVITWQRDIVNQEGKVVQDGQTITIVEGRANLVSAKKSVAPIQPPSENGNASQNDVGAQHQSHTT